MREQTLKQDRADILEPYSEEISESLNIISYLMLPSS